MAKSKSCVPEKMKPSLYLSDEQAKQFQNVEVGDSVTFDVKAKLRRKSKSEELSGSKSFSVDLEITKILYEPNTEKKLEGKEF